jgi:hypothetical protein
MSRRVLVVSHADADGHVIAEQVRRNLEWVSAFDVTTVVDPARTKDHKAWLHLDALHEVDKCDLVFFVDLMFAPASFGAEAEALVQFAQARPTKTFFILDHHPLPLRRLSAAANVRATYRQDVLDCTFGPPSWMMIIAALCEKQPTRAGEIKKPVHDTLAAGVKRAAALGGPLPGERLSALLRFDHWSDLEALGREDASEHRLPRGRRPTTRPSSKILAQLEETANNLLKSAARQTPPHPVRTVMSYDFENVGTAAVQPGAVFAATRPVAQPKDLEAIVVLLELAAVYLTTEPGKEFTVGELIAKARDLGGNDVVIDEQDAKIVLDKAHFLKKLPGKKFTMK